MSADTLHRFLFPVANVRGELVHLDESWRTVLERHDYPETVRHLLGQMLVASTLLTATIKISGSIIMQVQGDGPITLMVVECRPKHTDEGTEWGSSYELRGMALWSGEVPAGDLAASFGTGRLVITIDPGAGMERYQGIVELTGTTLAEAIDDYLERSEQLPTRMWLAADGQQAAGLLLQRLPGSEIDAEHWNRLTTLSATITDRELLELEGREVLHRLFHEEDLQLFPEEPVRFHCSCSRERVAEMLRGMGLDEILDIVQTEGAVDVNCEFCNMHYRFDAVDAQQLFVEQPQPEVGKTRH
ncbi:MAG TPA: Hsp33 family molecular chaperone HslO [Gammaproteobacteria bacterium]